MKKIYSEPKMKITKFLLESILCSSGDMPDYHHGHHDHHDHHDCDDEGFDPHRLW